MTDDHDADGPRAPAAGTTDTTHDLDDTGGPGPAGNAATAGQRIRLDRDRIVAAALRLAREHGVGAVTMRRVALELGSGAMSLYRHVTDREELLTGMLDAVAGELELPPVDHDPRAELTAVMTAWHDLFHREHWMLHVLVVDRLASTRLLPLTERVLAALDRAGLDRLEVFAAYGLLSQHVYGAAMAARHRRDSSVAMRLTLDALRRSPHRYPTMTRLFAGGTLPERRYDYAANLARVLDGVLGPRP